MVERGLAKDLREAGALILAGVVRSGTRRIDKPGELLVRDASLEVRARPPYVSRGGVKLAHALDVFAIDPRGWVALDGGASTGGFSDCLLQRGVSRVYAVDVGYGQLAWSLRNDERVVVMERTNVRSLVAADLDPRPRLVTADISFGSLTTLLPVLRDLVEDGGHLVVLVKPQFEVGREQLYAGIVTDADVRRKAVARVVEAGREAGLRCAGETESPIRGAEGNREFLLHLLRTPR